MKEKKSQDAIWPWVHLKWKIHIFVIHNKLEIIERKYLNRMNEKRRKKQMLIFHRLRVGDAQAIKFIFLKQDILISNNRKLIIKKIIVKTEMQTEVLIFWLCPLQYPLAVKKNAKIHTNAHLDM
jgi:hypothetical protein